jgi:hypothetical protein
VEFEEGVIFYEAGRGRLFAGFLGVIGFVAFGASV